MSRTRGATSRSIGKVADGSSGPRSGVPDNDASQILDDLLPLLSAQRTAILARDVVALNRATDALSQRLPTLEQLSTATERQSPGPDGGHAFMASARQVWEQIRLNQLLLQLGIEASHHFARVVAGSLPGGDPALFSGLG
jgi:hypothetical protein